MGWIATSYFEFYVIFSFYKHISLICFAECKKIEVVDIMIAEYFIFLNSL